MTETLPNFICIGGFKCATTWLHDCLAEHPEVFVPDFKEVHFFDKVEDDGLYDSELRRWYDNVYSDARGYPVRGSITPGYLTTPEVPGRIKRLLPDAQLLAILRDPVERARSHYFYVAGRQGGLPYTFDELLDNPEHDPNDVLRVGCFGRYLPHFYGHFPSEQLEIMLFDELKNDNREFFARVCRRLEIDDTFVPSVLTKKSNAARQIRSPRLYRVKHGIARFLNSGRLDVVRRAIKRTGIPSMVARFNTREVQNPPLTSEQRRKLVEYYREDIEALEALIDRDLSHWMELD